VVAQHVLQRLPTGGATLYLAQPVGNRWSTCHCGSDELGYFGLRCVGLKAMTTFYPCRAWPEHLKLHAQCAKPI